MYCGRYHPRMPRGRPLSETSRIVLRELGQQPRAVHQLARDLQASERFIGGVAYELKAAGRLAVVGTVRSPRGRQLMILGVAEQPAEDDRPAWFR